jgi:hypothetical protein
MRLDQLGFPIATAGHQPVVLRRAVGIGLGACGLAAASLLVPSVPTTDAWGWIIWGREIAHGTLHTAVGGSPSWKPLPVAFTTLLSFMGKHAPEGWLFVARALGLAGVALAYLAGKRLAGRGAGIVAALALVLASGWLRGFEHGYSEPLVVSLLLGALLAHLDRRPVVAFLLVAAASLARPELWPLLAALAVWLGVRERRLALPALLVVVIVPVLWVGADWLGSGTFLNGGKTASQVAKKLSAGDMLSIGLAMPSVPVLVLSAAGLAAAAVRRERLLVVLGLGVVVWALGLAAGVALGYPPSNRLMFPLMAGVCVLAGVGAARLVELGGARDGRVAFAVVLAALALPSLLPRADGVPTEVRAGEARARLQLDLRHAARMTRAEAVGTKSVAVTSDLTWSRGAVAWEWRLPLGDVQPLARPRPGSRLFAFVPRSRRPLRGAELVTDTRDWRVLLDMRKSKADVRRAPD